MRTQRGFTVIEVLLATAITGIIIPTVAAGIYSLSHGTAEVNPQLLVHEAMDTASNWLYRDLSQAQTTDVADGAPPVNHMRVDWIDQTGWAVEGAEAHFAEYTLSGTNLVRNYDGATHTVAKLVADIQFTRSGQFITLMITSSLDNQTQTLSYYIRPRSDEALQ